MLGRHSQRREIALHVDRAVLLLDAVAGDDVEGGEIGGGAHRIAARGEHDIAPS